MTETEKPEAGSRADDLEIITLGGGCFWCTEAVFSEVEGVSKVESGYSGGTLANPTYQEVCSGTTGHAEVVQVTFDPKTIPLQEILDIFFSIHDPTTPNRQGSDVGEQYRSIIFYRDEGQKKAAEEAIRAVNESKAFGSNHVVTQIVPFKAFYAAEDYHQEYFANNPRQPYCQIVIAPKVDKFRRHYQNKIRAS
jgi:peptide-methionine (S)-S-oxide reductase